MDISTSHIAQLLACALTLIAVAYYRLRVKRKVPVQTFELTSLGLRTLHDSEVVEEVLWRRLTRVAIKTTDCGPIAEDFHWMLGQDDGKGCAIPQAWPGTKRLLECLQKLPRFDNQALIAASGSVQNATFECWQGESGEAVPAFAEVAEVGGQHG
jgi:hypothetical protein